MGTPPPRAAPDPTSRTRPHVLGSFCSLTRSREIAKRSSCTCAGRTSNVELHNSYLTGTAPSPNSPSCPNVSTPPDPLDPLDPRNTSNPSNPSNLSSPSYACRDG